jgi:hypothetical protein
LDLTYVPRDGVLLITTPEESETMPVTRLYPVADLVPVTDPPRTWLPNAFGFVGSDFDALIEVITSIVAPTTWWDAGGPGSIEGEPYSMTLVAAQTNGVHEQMEQLLVKIRKTMPKEATAETMSDKNDENGLRLVVYFVMTKAAIPPKSTEKKQNSSESKVSRRLPAQARCHTFLGPMGYAGMVAAKAEPFADGELLEVIQELVEPDSWKKAGVYARAAPGRLIIRQTPEVHQRIGLMLTRLGVVYHDSANMPSGGFGGGMGMGGMSTSGGMF